MNNVLEAFSVLTLCMVVFSGMYSGGIPLKLVGRFTDVKANRDGKWICILEHASAPLPPSPDGVLRGEDPGRNSITGKT